PIGGYAPQGQPQYAQYPGGYVPGAPVPAGTPSSAGMYQAQPGVPGQASPAYVPQPQGGVPSQGPYGIKNAIHNQLYIPEGATKPAQAGGGQEAATGKFEQRMKSAEKG